MFFATIKDAEPAAEHVLVRRAVAGDEDAEDELIERLMPIVRARVRRFLARSGRKLGPDQGDDLVQDIWLRLIEDGGRRLLAYDPSRAVSLESFAGMITEREIGNLRQKAGARKRGSHLMALAPLDEGAPSGEASPEAEAEARELAARLGEHLGRELPVRGQLVLRYAFADELPVERVAQILGVTVQVVYNWQHKIRAAARAFLGEAARS